MIILTVSIEKDGDTYTGHSINLPGLSVTAKTFDQAQTAILDAMDKRIDELNEMHYISKPISRRPVEESIGCVFKSIDWSKDDNCCNSAKKDGLCLVHWKKLYGHPYGTTLKTCPLCGENDQDVLRNYASPCSFKIENPDWENRFEELKVKKHSQLAKERREVRLKKTR
jgi:hypothetical protein